MIGDRVEILPFHREPHRYNGWAGRQGTVVDARIHNDCSGVVLIRTDDPDSLVWRELPDVRRISHERT